VIGLGTGSLACHRKTSERWDFFEIDPEVVRIAGDPHLFNFMSACAPDASIMLGDARLTLPAASGRYDLIVLDAFSSDAIPVHLLTAEAFHGYLSKLSPHGVIVAHISNRHLDLAPVIANAAQSLGLVAFLRQDDAAGGMSTDLNANARVVVLGRSPGDVGAVAASWTRLQPDPSSATWTDDYSNILGAMLRKQLAW
jgi:spermidine synthase